MPTTCTCGEPLAYKCIGRNPKSDQFHHVYQCTKCKKTFMSNPGVDNPNKLLNRPIYKKAINLYETFNMKPVDKMYSMNISVPGKNNPLVHMGHVAGIIYISDKEGKPNQQYIHETEKPYPAFYVTADGKTFLMSGGKMKIETNGKNKGWLVH